jgi:hypothetical protein
MVILPATRETTVRRSSGTGSGELLFRSPVGWRNLPPYWEIYCAFFLIIVSARKIIGILIHMKSAIYEFSVVERLLLNIALLDLKCVSA